MKSFLFFSGLLFSSLTYGQNVSYKVLTDDPMGLKNVAVSIDPFFADTWGTNTTLGFGLRADALILGRFSFNVDLRKAYMDMQARTHFDESLPTPEKELKKQTFIELGAGLTLLDRTKNRSLKVVLSQSSYTSGNTKYTNTKYLMVPGTVRKITQLSGGLTIARTAFDVQDALGEGSSFTATLKDDTTSFSFGSFGNSVDGSAIYGAYSMMNMVVLSGGFSRKTITNLLIETDGYGTKGNVAYHDFYVHALFAPVISFADVQTVGGKTWELSNSDMKRLGWKMGYSFRSSSKSFFSYKFELGSRPGFRGEKSIIGANAYLLLTMGWSIPLRVNL